MKRGVCWFALIGLGLCLVFLHKLVWLGAGFLLFGGIAVVCAIERTGGKAETLKAILDEPEEKPEPMIEGTTTPAKISEAYHTAIYMEDDNPGAIAMIEKGEEMVLEGERRIREGDYYGGMKLVQEGEKRINRGQRFLKKGGDKYEEFYGKGLEHV